MTNYINYAMMVPSYKKGDQLNGEATQPAQRRHQAHSQKEITS